MSFPLDGHWNGQNTSDKKQGIHSICVPIRDILEGLVLELCVYYISISCGTYMGGKGLKKPNHPETVASFLYLIQLKE